ncbi:MAG: histidinol-phosphatase [Desulfurococcales archaeon ex4484_204]|nr:MAG: histidinol-phosphatase [Desulfurococcales archaeon ex4484_204]
MFVKADLHIHSMASDGRDHPKYVVKAAKEKGLLVISITDHNTFLGSMIALNYARGSYPLVIPGSEVRTEVGDILVLCPEPIEITRSSHELIDVAHDNNCILIPAHPLDLVRLGMGFLARAPIWDGVEVFNANSDPITNVLTLIAFRNHGGVKLANSDAHVIEMIGSAYTVIEVSSIELDEVLNALRNDEATHPVPGYEVIGIVNRGAWAVRRMLSRGANTATGLQAATY